MSIHIDLTPEAEAALRRQKLASSLTSAVVTVLTVVLIGLAFTIILIAPFDIKQPEVIIYSSPSMQEQPAEKPLNRVTQNKPSPPSSSASASRMIVTSTAAQVAIPTPDFESDSLDFGAGDSQGFGFGWGNEGNGAGMGGSSIGFGSTQAIAGGLRGRLFDFKKDHRNRPVEDFDPSRMEPYAERIDRIQKAGFSDSSLNRFFQAPQELSLTQLAIPITSANEGPAHFNAEKDIEPRGWMAHYQGRIVSPRNITFRFAGRGDDYLAVYVNGRPRLHASWPSLQEAVSGRWEPARGTVDQYASGLRSVPLIFGDWITLKAGEEVKLDIGLGERPGGDVGFILLVEERGVTYKTAPDGRPILPLFTTQPISDEARREISAGFGDYLIEWENVPVFPAR